MFLIKMSAQERSEAKNGAKIDESDNEKNGVLHHAVRIGSPEIITKLIQWGADPYHFNSKGFVPHEVAPEDKRKYFQVCA